MKKQALLSFITTFLLLGSIAFNPGRIHACSCVQADIDEQYFNSQYIFKGKVTNVDYAGTNGDGSNTATFEIDEVFKGDLNEQMSVTSLQSSASCGIYFTEGEEWVIFAENTESEFGLPEGITTNLCRGNVLIDVSEGVDPELIETTINDLRDLAEDNGVDSEPNTIGEKKSEASVVIIGLTVIGAITLITIALYVTKGTKNK